MLIELTPGHHRRIDLAAQCGLRRCERARQIGEAGAAENHQVHVAAGTLAAGRHAAVDERQLDLLAQRLQCLAQHVGKAGGLAQQCRKLGKDRMRRIRLVVHLMPDLLPPQQAEPGQDAELAMQRTGGCTRQARELAHVHRGIWMHQQRAQHGRACLAEKFDSQ